MIDIRDKKEIRALEYAFSETPFGVCLTAWCDGKICDLSLFDSSKETALVQLQQRWQGATIKQATHATIFDPTTISRQSPPDIILTGTPFQIKVWRALLDIPFGTLESYSSVAHRIGTPKAVRAVASAIAANKIAILVPCHRVVRSDGSISGFRWGIERKKQLQKWEE